MSNATALARLPGALLLGARPDLDVGDSFALRALWGEREAAAFLFGIDEVALARVALTVANTVGNGISPVRLAGRVLFSGKDEDVASASLASLASEPRSDTGVVVVVEEESGVSLLGVLQAVREQPGAFPVDVACALALSLLRFAHGPHVDDLTLSWAGRLQASPMPRLQRRGVLRFFSADEVRGRPAVNAAVRRTGAVLYELLTGASPLFAKGFAEPEMNTLRAIVSDERIPIGRRRALPPALEALIDGMVSPTAALGSDVAGHELNEWAAADAAARAFLATFLSSSFAARKDEDREFWEQARLQDATAAPLWTFVAVDPVANVDIALSELQNRDGRTD